MTDLRVYKDLTNREAAYLMLMDARKSDKKAAVLEKKRDDANTFNPTMTGRDLHENAMWLRGHAKHYRKEARMLRCYPNTKRQPWTS